MYFLYFKSNGKIGEPIHRGKPSQQALSKKVDCEIGSGIKWENVELFYSSDEEFPNDFARTAPLGKYYIDGNEVKENLDWIEPEEENGYNK